MDQYPIQPIGLGSDGSLPTSQPIPSDVGENKATIDTPNGNGNGFKFAKYRRLVAPWLAVFVLLAGLGAAFMATRQSTELRQQASGSNPIDLAIQPSTVTLNPGQSTTVNIVANTNGSSLSAVDLRITSSNAAVIDFASADLTQVLTQQLPEGGGIVINNSTNDYVEITAGVKCTESSSVGCGAQSGTGLIIATLTLQATANGTTDLAFDNSSQVAAVGQDGDAKGNTSGSSVTVGDPSTSPSPSPSASPSPSPSASPSPSPSASPSPSPSPTPDPGDFYCSGFQAQKPIGTNITEIDAGNDFYLAWNITNPAATPVDGIVSFTLDSQLDYLVDGSEIECTYTESSRLVSCIRPNFLPGGGTNQRILVIAKDNASGVISHTATATYDGDPEPSTCSSSITITGIGENGPGDANGDGMVNILDYSILSFNYLKVPLTDPRADFNDDGIINILDYSILQYYYGTGVQN